MARPENEPQTELALRLREVRKALGDQDRNSFASRIGLPKNTLGNYERGLREPPASVIAAYKQMLGVSLDWLLTGGGEMFSQSQTGGFVGSSMLDRETMRMAIEAVEEGLSGRAIASDKKAELVLVAYDILMEDEGNKNNVIKLVRAA